MPEKTEAFAHSQTRENLMRAFAGESQARNRYTIAAGIAHKSGLEVIQGLFLFTADQEKAHAKQFYRQLHDLGGQTIRVDGTYPVDLYADLLDYLRAAQHNEYGEWEHDYASFARTAMEEGFPLVGKLFENIANVEKIHGDRFGRYADMLNRASCSPATQRWSGCASTAAMWWRLPPLRPTARCAATPRATSSGWSWRPTTAGR